MRAMILGTVENDALDRVRAYAESHPVELDALIEGMKRRASPALDPGFRCVIPGGFRVAFTIERHPAGWCRHLSVSVAGVAEGVLPHSAATQMIGRALGMRMHLFDPTTTSYFEYRDPERTGQPFAVNIVEPMEAE